MVPDIYRHMHIGSHTSSRERSPVQTHKLQILRYLLIVQKRAMLAPRCPKASLDKIWRLLSVRRNDTICQSRTP
jgi:hypothetical protein